jgi:hypothetical protein
VRKRDITEKGENGRKREVMGIKNERKNWGTLVPGLTLNNVSY